jgi:hypothetical protein
MEEALIVAEARVELPLCVLLRRDELTEEGRLLLLLRCTSSASA